MLVAVAIVTHRLDHQAGSIKLPESGCLHLNRNNVVVLGQCISDLRIPHDNVIRSIRSDVNPARQLRVRGTATSLPKVAVQLGAGRRRLGIAAKHAQAGSAAARGTAMAAKVVIRRSKRQILEFSRKAVFYVVKVLLENSCRPFRHLLHVVFRFGVAQKLMKLRPGVMRFSAARPARLSRPRACSERWIYQRQHRRGISVPVHGAPRRTVGPRRRTRRREWSATFYQTAPAGPHGQGRVQLSIVLRPR